MCSGAPGATPGATVAVAMEAHPWQSAQSGRWRLSTLDKIRVALLFGGRSAEHEVSLVSARYVFDVLHAAGFDVLPLAIGTDGRWRLCTGNGGASGRMVNNSPPSPGASVTSVPVVGAWSGMPLPVHNRHRPSVPMARGSTSKPAACRTSNT